MVTEDFSEVGTNNITSKAQRNKTQRSFQPVKAQRNFRNELLNSVQAQRNSTIAEPHFRTKLKRNLTFAIEISRHNAKFLCVCVCLVCNM